MSPAGGSPILCLQKRILSPSCLPAFGKVVFYSLYRLISHCERDFSFASERDSHFWQDNITTFFAPCQSCKIVSSCRAWSSERPGPGASAGGVRPAQMRSSGWGWWRVELRFGWCIDGRNWAMGYCWFLKVTIEVIEGVLMCWRIRLLLICDVHCCLFAQSLLCLCSPMLFFCWNFTGCNFGLWNKNRYIIVRYKTVVLL